MTRNLRQSKLLEIIEASDIDTQQELTSLLTDAGFKVTQATVSRDIQELGLIKTPNSQGKSRYVKPLDPKLSRLRTLFHQSVLNIDYSENFIVVRTLAGSANAASVLIDSLENPQIMGSIAGDDTILIIIKERAEVEKTAKLLMSFID